MKGVFQSKIILFLGCSLDSDRVVDVLERFGANLEYYALVGLPEETKNTGDPFAPVLTPGSLGYQKYNERRKALSKRNINRIWYPAGAFTAMDVLLKALGAGPSPAPKRRSNVPEARRTIVGRDRTAEDLYKLCQEGKAPVFALGTGGIGKTEVCHMVLRRMENEGKYIVYGNVTDIRDPVSLCHTLSKILKVQPWPEEEAVDLGGYLDYLRGAITAKRENVLYLDNWEDLWDGLDDRKEVRRQLLLWLRGICQDGVPVLVSSRDTTGRVDVEVTSVTIPVLKDGDDRELFERVYRSKNDHRPLDEAALEALLPGLDGHPLSIVLTATHAATAICWEDVLSEWARAEQDSDSKHDSLKTALKISWDAVSKMPDCITVWGLLALCRGDMNREWLKKLARDEEEASRWKVCAGHLYNASLLDYEGENLTMLQPVKEVFFQLAGDAAQPCFDRWNAYFLPRLKLAEDYHNPERQEAHLEVMAQLPQLYSLLERMLKEKRRTAQFALALRMLNYFQFAASEGVHLLRKLSSDAGESGLELVQAQFKEYQGDLLRRLGKVKDALVLYNQAEELFRQEQDDLGLANTLRGRGDLLRRMGRVEDALALYTQAEELFRQEQDDLGLANTLQSRGDLWAKTGQREEALVLYGQAEALYREERDKLGLANTLRSRGDLIRRLGGIEESLALYTQAEALYREEQSKLGLANTLRSRGDLLSRLGRMEESLALYTQAEELFRQEQDDLGLANTLRSRGDLLRRVGSVEEALALYAQAEALYRKGNEKLGLANTLRNRGDLLHRMGKAEEALELYAQAEALYREVQDNLGLANTLRSRGDLLRRLERLEDALALYTQAEALYRKEQAKLGLANTLKSRGILFINKGDASGAVPYLREALECYRLEKAPFWIAFTCACLAMACSWSGDPQQEVQALADEAREIARSLSEEDARSVLDILKKL